MMVTMQLTLDDLKADLDALLEAYVAVVARSRPDAQVRQGQREMAHDLLESCLSRGQFVAVGPTGLGKASVLLSVAFVLAIRNGERTAISTYSNSLLDQMLTKDGPEMNEAARVVFGRELVIKGFKGQSNYACKKRVFTMLSGLVSHPRQVTDVDKPDDEGLHLLANEFLHNTAIVLERASRREAVQQVMAGRHRRQDFKVVGEPISLGDWAAINVDVCAASACPFSSTCEMLADRHAASKADIVVTNHWMPAIQASKNVPLVLGSERLGEIHHLMCDEAHGLTTVVRDQSRLELNGGHVERAGTAALNSIKGLNVPSSSGSPASMAIARVMDLGQKAGDLSAHLTKSMAPLLNDKGELDCSDGLPVPIADAMRRVVDWSDEIEDALGVLLKHTDRPSDVEALQKGLRELKGLRGTAKKALSKEHSQDGRTEAKRDDEGARWIETKGKHELPTWCYGAIDVSKLISSRLVNPIANSMTVTDWAEDFPEESLLSDGTTPSFTAVSATLPPSFCDEIGLHGRIAVRYDSPFAPAYRRARCYIPMLTAKENELLFPKSWGMDTGAHAQWAAQQIVHAVLMNRGRALVIAASKANQAIYVSALRKHLAGTGINVYEQPQQGTAGLDEIVTQWREHDPSSVLVGVESVGTGLDARGETCTLVIVDRPSRKPSNFVDNARSAAVRQRTNLGRWESETQVYVSDATLRLEQAVGRLIRDVTDYGMAMVLDPRLVRPGTEAVRQAMASDPSLMMPRNLYSQHVVETYYKGLRSFVDQNVIVHDKKGQWAWMLNDGLKDA